MLGRMLMDINIIQTLISVFIILNNLSYYIQETN